MKPNPLSPYAVSKLAAEYYCRVYSHIYGTPTVCLRYFNVFGPRQNPYSNYSAVIPKFISHILEGKAPTINGDGSITRDFVFVKDVVHANIQAIKTQAEGVFNIANGKQTSLKELAELIMNRVGTKVEIIYGPNRTGDVQDSFADITEAKDKLQYVPKYDIKKGLKETIKWYQMRVK
jgi:UDP-glucose 4-epimerase